MLSNNWINYYQSPDMRSWQGRQDSEIPERFNQVIELIDLTIDPIPENDNYSFVIIGFACDEGVRRNLGRVGASHGPDAIRSMLASLPFNYYNSINIYDVGNICCLDQNLEQAQEALGQVVEMVLLAGCHPIVLGGGHETAWGHYQGIAHTDYANNLGIINFDAHFDLRPKLDGDLGTSGTPFTQIAEHRESKNLDFDYFCLGIQPMANTMSLYEEAEILNVDFIEASDLNGKDNVESVKTFMSFVHSHENLYVSICLDVFATAVAPGVSTPQPLGLMPSDVLPYLKLLASSDKVVSLDIVELAPKLDQDNHTAKLAAQLIATYIDTLCLEE